MDQEFVEIVDELESFVVPVDPENDIEPEYRIQYDGLLYDWRCRVVKDISRWHRHKPWKVIADRRRSETSQFFSGVWDFHEIVEWCKTEQDALDRGTRYLNFKRGDRPGRFVT